MRIQTVQALIALDAELTGKSLQECKHTASHQGKEHVFDIMSNLYYLSDGGYSRLRVAEDFTVHLAQGARAEVQFNWEYASKAISAVNTEMSQEALEPG